jgi:hypothetical protein
VSEYLTLIDLTDIIDTSTGNLSYYLLDNPQTAGFFKFKKIKYEGEIRPYRRRVIKKEDINSLIKVLPYNLFKKLKGNQDFKYLKSMV